MAIWFASYVERLRDDMHHYSVTTQAQKCFRHSMYTVRNALTSPPHSYYVIYVLLFQNDWKAYKKGKVFPVRK
jgi:hypothetical protein